MKVLLVIPKLYNGGIEKIASNFSMNLGNDCQQFIYSIMDQNQSYDFKVKPIILDRKVSDSFFGKLVNFVFRIFKLRQIVANNDVDVVVSFGERCNIISMLSFVKCKTVITIHSQLSIENKNKGMYGHWGTFLAKLLYRKADSIVAVSNIVKDDFVKLFNISADKVTVIYNGHEISKIKSESIKDSGVENSDILSVGRITFAKGHFHLLRALSIVKQEFPSVKLKVVGDYEEHGLKSLLEEVICKYNLKDNVRFVGYQDNPYKHIKNTRSLILSSIFEGFPGVVVESLALGVPVIATDCGGASEILQPENSNKQEGGVISQYGILTKKLNGIYDVSSPFTKAEFELAESILLVLSSKVKFSVLELENKAQEYSVESMMKSYSELLTQVCK